MICLASNIAIRYDHATPGAAIRIPAAPDTSTGIADATCHTRPDHQ